MKSKLFKLFIIILVPIFFAIVIDKALTEYDNKVMGGYWEEEFFGKETYAELKFACSDEDFEAVQPVLDLAEEAFSYVGNDEDEARKKFGKLSTYSNIHHGLFSESHTLDFITARLEDSSGYMWIQYTHRGYDEKGNNICGSGSIGGQEIKSRWTLEKIDGEWVVTEILEHP